MRLSRRIILIFVMALAARASQAQVADVLSFMLSADSADSVPAAETAPPAPDMTGSILSDIASATPLGSLDYITSAYSASSYHDSGFNGTAAAILNPLSLHPGYRSAIFTSDWGKITSGFGFRENLGRMHHGIDVSMAVGDTVRAPLSGRVDRVKYDAKGYGHYVVLVHSDGMETRYAHLSRPLVSPGQSVETGQPIALSGSSGNSTGPHLHFETRYMGNPVDPRTVFDFTTAGQVQPLAATQTAQTARAAIATGFNGSSKSLKAKSTYVVRPGDTLGKIARRAGLTTLRLCQLNFITEDAILMPGTMLKLR